jgi:hypothetical protein
MKEYTLIQIKMPDEFSFELDRDRQELKEEGIKDLPSKADLILKYARIGRLQEKIKNLK